MSIRHYDHSHETVAEVKACSGVPTPGSIAEAAQPFERPSLMSPKQPTIAAEKNLFSRNRHVRGVGQAFAMAAQGHGEPEPDYDTRDREGGAEPGEVAKRLASSAPQRTLNGSGDRRAATDPMVRFVKSLANSKSMDEGDRAEALRYVEEHEEYVRTRGEKGRRAGFQWARKFIEDFKNAPARTTRSVIESGGSRLVEDGMYRNPESGEIFKVQFPRGEIQHGIRDPQHLYAKALEIVTDAERDEDGKITKPAKVRFNYVSGLVRKLRPEWRMTLAEAKAFGALYGVCMDCGRTLTHEQSINAGVGPKCGEDGRWARGKDTVDVG